MACPRLSSNGGMVGKGSTLTIVLPKNTKLLACSIVITHYDLFTVC